MAVNVASLVATLEADTSRFSSGMQSAGGQIRDFGSKVGSAGRSLTTGITLPLVGVAAGAVSTANTFNLEMSRIQGLVGVAGDEVEAMKSGVLDLAGETARAPDELARAMFAVQSAGISGSAAMDTLTAAAKASAGGLGDTQAVALAAASAMNAYGQGNLDAEQAIDIMTATVKAGNLSAEELSSSLGKIIPVSSAAGVGLDEVGAAVALVTRNGASASEAVTQTQAALRSMIAPNKALEDGLKGLGMTTEDLSTTLGEQGLMAALRKVEEAAGGNTGEMAKMLGSSEALSAALTLLNGDADTVAGVFDDVANAAGSTQTAFDVAAEQGAFQFQQAMTELKVALIEIGTVLAPIATQLLGFVRDLVGWFRNLSPEAQKIIMIVAGIAAAIGPLLMILGPLISGIGALVTVIGFLISPVGLVILAVAALVAGFIYAYTHFETFREVVDAVVRAVVDAVGWLVDLVKLMINGEWSQAWEMAKTMVTEALAGLWEALQQLPGWLADILPIIGAKLAEWGLAFLQWVIDVVPPLLLELGKLLLALGEWATTEALPAIAEKMLEWAGAFFQWIIDVTPTVIAELGKLLVALTAWITTEALPAILAKAVEMGAALLTWVANFLAGLPGELARALRTIVTTILGWLPAMFNLAVSLAMELGKLGVEFISRLPGILAGMVRSIVSGVLGWIGTLLTLGGTIAGKIADGIISGLANLWQRLRDAMQSALRRAVSALNPVNIGSKIVSSIPGVGGVVGAGKAVLGALTPWPAGGMVTANSGTRILPDGHVLGALLPGEVVVNPARPSAGMSALAKAGLVGRGSGGTTTINVVVNTGVGDPGLIGSQIADYLRQYVDTNGPLPARLIAS